MKKVKDINNTLFIYCRVSTSGQEQDGSSLGIQKDRGIKLSKKMNLSPVVIQEQGSGMKPYIPHTDEKGKKWGRPLFTELMDELEDGKIKNVWVDEDTRLTRFDQDQQFIHLSMKKKDVNLFVGTSTSPKKWDWITDLVDTIITKVNQQQIRTQVRKSIRSRVKLFNEGCYMKGESPFGYKLVDKKLEIDEEQSEWVKKIYNWYDDGKSTIWIRNELFVNGVRPPRSLTEWFPLRSISVILQNENYIGKDVYHDKSTSITHTNKCPSLVDKDIFDSIQKKFNHNRGHYQKVKRDFLLKGIIKCSDGTPMNCIGLNSVNKHELYRCNHSSRRYLKRKTTPCPIKKSLRMVDTNKYVWDLLLNTLGMSYNYKEEIKKEIMGNKPQYSKRSYNLKIKKLNKELMDMDERKMDLETRYYGGELIKKKYGILMDTIETKENEIMTKVEKYRFQLQSLDQKSKWVDWLGVHFDRLDILRQETDYTEMRKWITKYIHEVIVLDYSKDTRQHTLVIKFRLPLFNDKFVWKLNKDGTHKTDKYGRWVYEILDGETKMTNPFIHQKSLNRYRFC
jgi:site-specific DNA recombinase